MTTILTVNESSNKGLIRSIIIGAAIITLILLGL